MNKMHFVFFICYYGFHGKYHLSNESAHVFFKHTYEKKKRTTKEIKTIWVYSGRLALL